MIRIRASYIHWSINSIQVKYPRDTYTVYIYVLVLPITYLLTQDCSAIRQTIRPLDNIMS